MQETPIEDQKENKPEVFEADKKLDKRQMDVARILHSAFKGFRMMGGDISKNEKLWNSKAVHALKKIGVKESEMPVYLPIADYIRKLVINPIVPDKK